MSQLDLEYTRSQFPAFNAASLVGQSFFENAGGSFMCQQVMNRFQRYFEQRKVQPYYAFSASVEAGAEMDLAVVRFARYLNVMPNEVLFGPSTSQNTYVLANAMRQRLVAGDAIVVSGQEHEANSGVWRKLAENGVDLRIWPIDVDDGRLHSANLLPLLDQSVKLVAMTHCSNLIGEINNVREIADLTHAVGGILLVDGVSYCPHGLPDVDALGADIYLFSTYKVYGPHQGVMVIRHTARSLLEPQAHYFNYDNPMKWMVPAGPDHAQMASSNGIIDYFDALDTHHGGADDNGRPRRVEALLRDAEKNNIKTLLSYISQRSDVRLIGPNYSANRAPTISFVSNQLEANDIVRALAGKGVMSGAGHFYAARVFKQMGLSATEGAVRLSFVHYTSVDDIAKAIKTLDEVL